MAWKVKKSRKEELLDLINEDIICNWDKYEDAAVDMLMKHYSSKSLEELEGIIEEEEIGLE